MKRKVLFISSTGGHLDELLQLAPLFEKYEYNIITEKDAANEKLKKHMVINYIFCHMELEQNYLHTYLNISIYV